MCVPTIVEFFPENESYTVGGDVMSPSIRVTVVSSPVIVAEELSVPAMFVRGLKKTLLR